MDCDVLVCADDEAAATVAIELAAAGGMKGWYCGPLANSVVAEGLTSLLIGINRRYKIPGSGIRITGQPKSAA
jgi:predicted dinucleotide-binding enzyme